jgi:hypothetical protein
MFPNPITPTVHIPHSDTLLRRLLGGKSFFTMLMTTPQVLTIWFGHQTAGVSLLSWSALPCLCRSVVLVRDTETRQEHLFAMRGLDGARWCCDHRSRYLWTSDVNTCP